ncbi:hypothetical protein D3C85_1077570 [compost metagenome]
MAVAKGWEKVLPAEDPPLFSVWPRIPAPTRLPATSVKSASITTYSPPAAGVTSVRMPHSAAPFDACRSAFRLPLMPATLVMVELETAPWRVQTSGRAPGQAAKAGFVFITPPLATARN